MLTAVSGRYSNTVIYTYDIAGRKATESLTTAGQTNTVDTDYDDAGRVATLTYPDGTEVDRTYTGRGQLATIAVDSTTIDTRSYDDGGRMTGSVYKNGVQDTHFSITTESHPVTPRPIRVFANLAGRFRHSGPAPGRSTDRGHGHSPHQCADVRSSVCQTTGSLTR